MIVNTSIGALEVERLSHHPARNRHQTGGYWLSRYTLATPIRLGPIAVGHVDAASTSDAVAKIRALGWTP